MLPDAFAQEDVPLPDGVADGDGTSVLMFARDAVQHVLENQQTVLSDLLLDSVARWLSRGNVLSRTFELYQEIHIFLEEEGHASSRYFKDPDFLLKLAYLCDMFDKPNALNLSLQGNNMHILKLSEKIAAFRKKLQLWIRNINEDGCQDCFPELHKFSVSNKLVILKICCPFSPNTFRNSRNDLQNTLQKKMSKNLDLRSFPCTISTRIHFIRRRDNKQNISEEFKSYTLMKTEETNGKDCQGAETGAGGMNNATNLNYGRSFAAVRFDTIGHTIVEQNTSKLLTV
nr:unnamed protein product [Callosobruchus chinensis]